MANFMVVVSKGVAQRTGPGPIHRFAARDVWLPRNDKSVPGQFDAADWRRQYTVESEYTSFVV
jgi:hypothetical protein